MDDFYDSIVGVVGNEQEEEIVVITGDFILIVAGGVNGHVGSDPENYKDQHGHYGYGTRKGKRF